MKYILLTTLIILLITIIACVVLSKLYRKYKVAYSKEHENLLIIQEEYSKLAEAYRIKKENKEKADEEISDLHNGTMSADDILPKRKSRK